jgi:activator of 2-hydroxyglutaryl-CoA dehydratase/predicted nucleotide-binding protein (sugar kinase/HSP70/actin superfamily)
MASQYDNLVIGLDVGSTTVKAVVLDSAAGGTVVWHDYQRHHTRQPEKVLELLERIACDLDCDACPSIRIFLTGSGAGPLVEPTGGKFVQEVNAVTCAVERLNPDVGSVVELGGQDAKIIIFKEDPNTGLRTAVASMNDKCASGTGATIDKCFIKVGADPSFATQLRFNSLKLHHVAAKCGVFAETDIVNLVKSGIPQDEVLNSLADAIVLQNLSVLTRGNTLRAKVALLGGPNTYLPFLIDCWRLRIPETWRDRGYTPPTTEPIEKQVFVPENSELYAALGAAYAGMNEPTQVGIFLGTAPLRDFIKNGRRARLGAQAGPPLATSANDLDDFKRQYAQAQFVPPDIESGAVVRAVIGLDGGSTSSKAVLVDEDGTLVAKAYQLSKGNPIADTQELLAKLNEHVAARGATLECLGFGVTGYAGAVLEECMLADVNIVETVAHMSSAVHYFGDVDVVCDIGGQDIKVLFLKNGDIQNFKLSNSCSAGNGMLLQAMADQFGLPVTQYADAAFRAELAPKFSYGCAVFLDTDRVNFQKEGFQKEELLAGLAQVLPKNVWQYVVQIPRLAALGRRFVLQGGTQYNLAAVKAQVDYIRQRVPDAEVLIHPHTGEAGALGAAFETLRRYKKSRTTRFIGMQAALDLEYTTRNDDSTQCHFCPNNCRRTFVDAQRPNGSIARTITGFSCEKGTVESEEAMLRVVAERKMLAGAHPNLVDYEARKAFQHFYKPEPLPEAGTLIDDVKVTKGLFRIKRQTFRREFVRSSVADSETRRSTRIGIPRVLNNYVVAPFLRTYFETLGIPKTNVVFSEPTTEAIWIEGGKYGSVDPCFPSKVVQAHIHQLLFHAHQPERGRPLRYIFFPVLTQMPNFVTDTVDNASCPIVAGTPEVIRAAFTKEVDFFAQRDIEYVAPALAFTEPTLLAKRLFDTWGPRLNVTEDENDFACKEAWKALTAFEADLENRGRAILETVEQENRLAILVLARPYHSDPGLNHGILEEFQALGYPILSVRSLPKSRAYLDRYYQDELDCGLIETPLQLSHLWPENYSANSAQKVWAANFAAHHPNVAVLDLSSFKCGHDAPTYGLIDSIVQTARTPSALLHDLDANKPGGSLKIRVNTYAHSLRLRQEQLEELAAKTLELERSIEAKRNELLGKHRPASANLYDDFQAAQRRVSDEMRLPPDIVSPIAERAGNESGFIRLRRKQDVLAENAANSSQSISSAAE